MPETGLQGATTLFIRRWGEMAAGWGISRTMAEIHALLYLAPEPLCMDDVMDRLEVSRGSASTNLRELVNWGLIRRVHHRGDRKEYFDAEKDVWAMFETITRERKRRELQPIVETIERCLEMIDEEGKAKADAGVKLTRQRLTSMTDFCESMNGLFNLVVKAGRIGLKPLGLKLAKLVG